MIIFQDQNPEKPAADAVARHLETVAGLLHRRPTPKPTPKKRRRALTLMEIARDLHEAEEAEKAMEGQR